MYNKLNITENHLRILTLFTKGYTKDYYIREAAKLLSISPRTAQLILEDLKKRGILKSESRGKIKTYRLDKSKDYLILVEQYKKAAFLRKHPKIELILQKIDIQGYCIIFGSYAKGREKDISDLDMLIVGEHKGIERASKTWGIKIHKHSLTEKNFLESLKEEDIVIKEIIKDHVIIEGTEFFTKNFLSHLHL